MHPALQNIASELDQLALQIGTVPAGNPFALAHGNWTFPAITSEELKERVEEIARDVRDRGKDSLEPNVEARLNDYPRRLVFVRGNTVQQMWGNSAAAVPALTETLDGLIRALRPALHADAAQDASARLSRLRAQVGGMETRVKLLQPKAADLEQMLKSIEETYQAAQELPTTLDDVSEAKERIERVNGEIEVKKANISNALDEIKRHLGNLEMQALKAKEYIDGCESAYRTSVGAGLATAFHERSRQLYRSMWGWVVGLVVSLVGGSIWSGKKIGDLISNAHIGAAPSIVVLDGAMAAISVAAPVWLAWLATRQIGQAFRLSEDYAFKASVARSYEGYRKEAADVNDALVERLLASALRRVDEEPLRVVETGSPGSPWHDLAKSPVVAKAFEKVPEFGEKVRELAAAALKPKGTDSTGEA